MAHRKPLGTTCHTVADWQGEHPFLHDALVTPAGTWYRIVGMEETPSMAAGVDPCKIRLTLERVAEPVFEADSIRWPDGWRGRAHGFEWYPRRPRPA